MLRSVGQVIASQCFIIPANVNIYFPSDGVGGVTTDNNLSQLKYANHVCLVGFMEMNNPAAADNLTTLQLVDSAGVDIAGWAFVFNTNDAAPNKDLAIIAPVPNFGARLSQGGASFRPIMVKYAILG